MEIRLDFPTRYEAQANLIRFRAVTNASMSIEIEQGKDGYILVIKKKELAYA